MPRKAPAKRRSTAPAPKRRKAKPRAARKAPQKRRLTPQQAIDPEIIKDAKRRRPQPAPEVPPFRPDPVGPDPAESDAYERHRLRTGSRQKSLSAAGREIGPLPDVENPERRAACEFDFRLFCETYHKPAFPLPWSSSQLEAIATIEETVLRGGLYALALERGSGKTTLCACAVEWAELYGHHVYVMLIGATDDKGSELLDSVKLDLETNELLLADFPEVCYPIVCLEGIAQRAKGQTLDGEPTGLRWAGSKRVVLPTVAGSVASGAIIGAAGIHSAVRGARVKTRSGTVRRPSLLVGDDLQTDESARSDHGSDKIERTVSGSLLGLAGPGQKLSGVFPCTIIEPGDYADRITDPEKHPEFHGQRSAMIRAWPVRMDLWERYNELRQEAFRNKGERREGDDPAPEATAFYAEHRQEMDEGFEVSWPDRKLAWELSAQQHAMNLYFRDAWAFFAEYQNSMMTPRSPAHPGTTEDLRLISEQLQTRLSGFARGTLVSDAQFTTAFIDVHERVLFWMVTGASPQFDGSIVDYGTYPETRRSSFTVGTFKPTLREVCPGAGQEGALTAALTELADRLFAQKWIRGDGVEIPLGLLLIDGGYMSSVIRRWMETYRRRDRCLISLGRQCGPNDVPFREYKQRPGERLGDGWLIRKPLKTSFKSQHLLFDTYEWKTFAARRLISAIGDPGAFGIFGKQGSRARHPLLARHLSSEYAQTTEGRHRVNVWSVRPGESENHWWDTFTGCMVGTHIQGARLGGEVKRTAPRRGHTRIKLTGQDGRGFFITDR